MNGLRFNAQNPIGIGHHVVGGRPSGKCLASGCERGSLSGGGGGGRCGTDAGRAQGIGIGQSAAGEGHLTRAGVGVARQAALVRCLHGDGPLGDAQHAIGIGHVVVARLPCGERLGTGCQRSGLPRSGAGGGR